MPLTDEEKKKIEEEEKYRSEVAASASSQTKQTHGLPALLSFFIPGLGQLIKGQVLKGIFVFIGFLIGLPFFAIPSIIIWVWQIRDAYSD
jgi:TM2 domain-containing membrane protein YozV